MRLRSEQQEETPSSHSGYYDSEAARKVLARAAEIEETNRLQEERLSAQQVEAIGAELGIDPEAVRQALGEIEPNVFGARELSAVGKILSAGQTRIFVPFAILAAAWLLPRIPTGIMAFPEIFILLVVSLLIATITTIRHQDRRLRMLGGGVAGFGLVTIAQYVLRANDLAMTPDVILVTMLVAVVAGVCLSGAGRDESAAAEVRGKDR